MAKAEYTNEFQAALRNEIQKLFKKGWQIEGFHAKCEQSRLDMLGSFNGYVDIGIRDQDNEYAFVGIEIEHISSYNQARENIRKLKAWAHNSPKRKCGLLHLLNVSCNLSEDEICRLKDFALENEKKDHGFFYEYMFYSPETRLAKSVAREVVASKDFRTRFYQLLKYVGSCE